MKKLLMFLCAVMFVFGMVGSASATIIFEDDFNRYDESVPVNNRIVGNGWAEMEADDDDVQISGNNNLILRDSLENNIIGAAITQTISTTNFNNLTIQFDWTNNYWAKHAQDSVYRDVKLYLSWDLNDDNWSDVWSHHLDLGTHGTPKNKGNFTEEWMVAKSISLPGDLDDESIVRIRLWTDITHGNMVARIDNFMITGDLAPVPEPATMMLFGIGLLGLAGVSRRKNA